MRAMSSLLATLVIMLAVPGCVEESSIPVVFDQELNSVTFENRLFTPVAVFRDNVVLDTLPALHRRTYPIHRKGIIRHAWKIVPVLGENGRVAGIQPLVDLGTQFSIDAEYILTSNSVPGETIFTPRIANFSPFDLNLHANYREEDEFWTDYVIPRNGITNDVHAPYFYWHARSNVYLHALGASGGYLYSRLDTGEYALELDATVYYRDAGATLPITVRW